MNTIHTIDLMLMGATGVVAAYFIPSSAGHIIVDCGPSSTLAALKTGVTNLGYNIRDVKHLLLTHIHLDHAGAAGTLAKELGLQVYVHSNGAPHLQRPERLLESATRIYGAMMDSLWGAFEAVPEQQIVVLEGSETLQVGALEIQAVYTPGHAIHHLAYAIGHDVFCGDVGGVRLQGSSHVVAPTPPPDIDFAAWQQSLEKLRALEPTCLYPTHFGAHNDVTLHLTQLKQNLQHLKTLSQTIIAAGGGKTEIAEAIKQAAAKTISSKDLEQKYALSTPYEIAANGLVRYWQKQKN